MKITLNTTIRPVGFDYARALAKSGSLKLLISGFPRFAIRKDELSGVPVSYCSALQAIFLVVQRLTGATSVSRWLAHISKVHLDVFTARVLSNENAVVFYSGAGLQTVQASRRLGILSVCQVHHCHVLEQEEILRREANACGLRYSPIYCAAEVRTQLREYGEVDSILCPSTAVKDSFVAQGIPGDKLMVVPHGITLPDRFPHRSERRNEGPFRVLYVGQLHFRKGLRYLLDAISQLGDPLIECRLVGPDFGLSGIKWDQYSSGILRPGAKKGADLWQEYADADIFVLPSVEEGFGLVVLEAMRAGLPVVITSAVGARDFVADGEEGFIVPPGDTIALRDKIAWLRDHPEERRRMGKLAQVRAENVKGWDDSAALLVAELEKRKSWRPASGA